MNKQQILKEISQQINLHVAMKRETRNREKKLFYNGIIMGLQIARSIITEGNEIH